MSYATEAALDRDVARFEDHDAKIYEVITYAASCPAGHPNAQWRSERIDSNQGRTAVSCRSCA